MAFEYDNQRIEFRPFVRLYDVGCWMLKLSSAAEAVLDLACEDAHARSQSTASYQNLLLVTLDMGRDGPLAPAFAERKVPRRLRNLLEEGLPPKNGKKALGKVGVSEELELSLSRIQRRKGQIDTHALLFAACEFPLVRGFLDQEKFQISDFLENAYDANVVLPKGKEEMVKAPAETAEASAESGKTSFLEKFGRNLTTEAKEGKLFEAIGREEELSNVCASLLRMQQNNPLLIGLPGTGKTAIVEHLALKMAEGALGPAFEGVSLIEIDLPGLVAGTRFRGDFEERIKGIISEVKEAKGKVIPFIDEIHLMMGAGSTSGGMDAANILKPALARGELRLIGATTPEEYRTTIAKDAAMARRFGPVRVEPPSEQQTVAIIDGMRSRIQKHHKVSVELSHCELAVQLAGRYIRNRNFPDKAIVVLDQAAALHRVEAQESGRTMDEAGEPLGQAFLYQAVERLTGISASRMAKGEVERLQGVHARLEEKVVGQPKAIECVMRVLRRRAASLAPAERPLGSFLFLGPSGVGKTELARVVAEEYFDSPYAIERFDMSEYAGEAASASLLGAPAGTVGSERGGVLTNALQRNPFAVYLFDEIEKADRSTLNIFLQMLDAGRITGRDGVTADCSHAVIVFTSNLGNRDALAEGEISEERRAEVHLDGAKRHLPPELFRRFDEVVPFNALSSEACRKVAELLLGGLAKRFESAHGQPLRFAPSVAEALAEAGYSPLYGARNLRYEMERRVEEPLVAYILQGEGIPSPAVGTWLNGRASFAGEEA